MNAYAARFAQEVRIELDMMARAGMRVPKAALEVAQDDAALAEYTDMGVGETAELLIELAGAR